MKKTILILLCMAVAALGAQAQEMSVQRTDGSTDTFSLADIDSVTFTEQPAATVTGDIVRIHSGSGISRLAVPSILSSSLADDSTLAFYRTGDRTSLFALADIDSMTFDSSSLYPVTIAFSGTSATVDNPLSDLGVAIDVAGADVTVTSSDGLAGVRYVLSGTATDGMFKVYSDADLALVLDGVTITNADGPAINIQADETISVELVSGTTSTLTDGATYADPPDDEDQKACFFSEGQLLIDGGGALVIYGQGDDQHGLGSDDYVALLDGDIVVAGSTKDGVHTNEGYWQLGGSMDVTAGSDGIDAGDGPVEISAGAVTVLIEDDDRDAIKCDGDIIISGGTIDLTVTNDQSKGLNAATVQLTGGTIDIVTSGGVVLEASGLGYDPSYCTGIKADDLVLVDGAAVTIATSGTAGRGVSCDGDIVVAAGSLEVSSTGGGGTYTNEEGSADAYTGPCLKADGDITISDGAVVLTHTGSGGKGISGDADLTIGSATTTPVLQVSATGSSITVGFNDTVEAKAVSVDSLVTIDSGLITLVAADDALKSKYRIDINDCTLNIDQSLEGVEAPFLYINGGEIRVHSTDDGLNATMGNDVEGDDGSELEINGGYIALFAPQGDGLDSNGTLTINGGTLVVHGPPNQPEVGLDVNGTWLMNGGFVVVAQINSMMVESPSNASAQRSVLLKRTSTLSGGTMFHIEDTAGNELVSFVPERNYSAILVSSPDLASGTSYRVYTGGSSTGSELDGLYTGGSYTAGTLRTTFTSSGTVQTINF